MGIQPYGLFGTNESNNSYGSGYEIKRQLATRQAQLDALSSKEVLTDDESKRKEQLTNTVNQLNATLNKRLSSNDGRQNNSAIASHSSQYTRNYSEGSVIAKSPYQNKSTVNNNSDYLKGFFLDLKI